mgnify:FL=1
MKIILTREWRRFGEQQHKPTAADVQSGAAKLVVTLDDVGEKLICSTATEAYKITPDHVTAQQVGSVRPEVCEKGKDPAYQAAVRDCVKAWSEAAIHLQPLLEKGPEGNLTADELRAELHLLLQQQLKHARGTFNSAEVQNDEAEEDQLRSMSVTHMAFAVAIKEILCKRSQNS